MIKIKKILMKKKIFNKIPIIQCSIKALYNYHIIILIKEILICKMMRALLDFWIEIHYRILLTDFRKKNNQLKGFKYNNKTYKLFM